MARQTRTNSLPPPFYEVFLAADDTLAARDQTAYYVSLPIVFGGDLDLKFEKAVCILIGENGSGKPTLLEMIVTMASSDEGGGAQGMTVVGPSRAAGKDAGRLGDLPRAAWLPRRADFMSVAAFFVAYDAR
ncbi:hypothetical protein [Sphingomonas sp. Leaf62]|uniref:hypothetical protein n=1 Tax=Sphingomonas sp. Leaf62 TaxID=1736228 RepID=UPI00070112C4|nr:hypothetical protein [Sphingomonas sp. Leaf62]KQN70832.1 hypothetical protein ASE91_06490 [Sphingomonas sp. Leaf62]